MDKASHSLLWQPIFLSKVFLLTAASGGAAMAQPAPQEDPTLKPKARAGVSVEVLQTASGGIGERLSTGLAYVDDLDEDGWPELLLVVSGTRAEDGEANQAIHEFTLISGKDAHILWRKVEGASLKRMPELERYPSWRGAICLGPDQDDDGTRDVFVGEPYYVDPSGQLTGRVVLRSGADGGILRELRGPLSTAESGARFGASVGFLEAEESGSKSMFFVGSPSSQTATGKTGRVFAYDAKSWSSAGVWDGSCVDGGFGLAIATFVAETSKEKDLYLAVGASLRMCATTQVALHSEKERKKIEVPTSTYSAFGHALCSSPPGQGSTEYLFVGAPYYDTPDTEDGIGCVYQFDTSTMEVQRTYRGDDWRADFGSSVACMVIPSEKGKLGRLALVVGAPDRSLDVGGPGHVMDCGEINVFDVESGERLLLAYGESSIAGLGTVVTPMSKEYAQLGVMACVAHRDGEPASNEWGFQRHAVVYQLRLVMRP